jgi:hypothetical protein
MVYLSSFIAASLAATLSVSGAPLSTRQDRAFTLQNGLDAQALKYVDIFDIDQIGTNEILAVLTSRLSTPTRRAQTARTPALTTSSLNVLMACSSLLDAQAAFSASLSHSLTPLALLSPAPLRRMLQLVSLTPGPLVVSMGMATPMFRTWLQLHLHLHLHLHPHLHLHLHLQPHPHLPNNPQLHPQQQQQTMALLSRTA